MLKKILLVLVLVIGGILAFAATRPDAYEVKRTAMIKASPSTIFTQINTLKKWEAWSPWAKIDPQMATSYSGPDSGKGAIYAWEGNNDVGKGSMEIITSTPSSTIEFTLIFVAPWESTSIVTFQLEPNGDGTQITWSTKGDNNFMGKLFGIFVDMDEMLGKDFETGLASLKSIAEAGS